MNHARFLSVLLPIAALAANNTGRTLIDAVQRGDRASVVSLIRQGADVNQSEPDGTTALQYAAHRNDTATAELLLRAGAKAGAVNAYGVSALSEAAAAGNAELIEKLLEAGASANETNPEGESVLMTAARSGDVRAVRLLLDRGAALNTHEQWKGQTALMWAAAANHAEVAQILLDHGAAVNAQSALVPPEIPRPANGNLISEQPKGGLTALLFAAREGAVETVRVLVRAGADLNFADLDGITPILMALINGHYDVAGVLAEAGADPNLADTWGRTPLYAAVDMHTLEPSTTRPAPRGGDTLDGLDLARILLERGAGPNPRLLKATPGRGIPDGPDPLLRAGTTPFLRAAKTGDVGAMRVLLDHGADPKLTTDEGVTALMAAAGQGWRFGDSQIPERDALEGVKLCLALGLEVNAVNHNKQTALHGAADRGADSIVRYLAEHGANLDPTDASGQTPLDVALGGEARGHPGYPTTAALLKELMADLTSGRPKN